MLQQAVDHVAANDVTDTSINGILARLTFGDGCGLGERPGDIRSGMACLSDHASETLDLGLDIEARGSLNGCHWVQAGPVLVASTEMDAQACDDIELAAYQAYTRLLSTAERAGYSSLYRFWNFVPKINRGAGDREEYKRFCTGRLRAFDEHGIKPDAFPAASALGHHSSGAVVYMIAGQRPGEHFENPRQERAYYYPRQYGPTSPSFARATRANIGNARWVFVSGTASILGHETQAHNNLVGQIAITLDNIEALQGHVSGAVRPFDNLRVYLRHPEHYATAEKLMRAHYPDTPLTFLVADICRADLLIEIEGAYLE